MQIFGVDILGINGRLIKFSVTTEENRRGTSLLGLAQKVVREGYLRAAKAIEGLPGNWGNVLEHQGFTIQLDPAESPKTSSSLDLPIAIMLLQASILRKDESIEKQIKRLREQYQNSPERARTDEARKKVLSELEALTSHRETIKKYRSRIADNPKSYLLIGTLNITDGTISSPEHGMFGMISAAKPNMTVIIAEDSEIHGALIAKGRRDIRIVIARDLKEVWEIILGIQSPRNAVYRRQSISVRQIHRYAPDFNAIEGVSNAKRAMVVALAGGHNILLVGPPGGGKSMLARAATKVLPDLSKSEMLEVNKIYSAKGELDGNEVILHRPFAEAQNVTLQALFGGGTKPPVPGIVSLAHRGVLLLDEINLFPSSLIEQLRTVLNDRFHRVQRVGGTIEYPCSFVLVAAMNPCECGYWGHSVCPVCNTTMLSGSKSCKNHPDAKLKSRCRCSRHEIDKYRCKLSGPLLDRIDLKVLVSNYDNSESNWDYASRTVKSLIKAAHEIQDKRYQGEVFGNRNAHVPDKSQVARCWHPIPERVDNFLASVYRKLSLTKRMEVKLLLVARTIADLEASKEIRVSDVKEAIQLMGLRDPYFKE